VIQQASPDVIYVPSYSPAVIWGAPPYYPYPPLYYPPYYGGAWFAWGVGVAIGIGIAGGWGCGWGNNEININNNNNFNRNSNIGGGNRVSNLPSRGGGDLGGGRSNWSHRPEHRGGTPYRDRATADRFGGSARGDSLSQRQSSARQQIGRQGGNVASNVGAGGLGNRTGGAGGAGVADRGRGTGAGGGGLGGGSAAGRADRIGSRDVSRSGASDRSAKRAR